MTDPTYTLDALRADIAAVVAYNWNDEERDYHEQDDDGRLSDFAGDS